MSSFWKCGYCSKQFRSEGYLDLHMDRKHGDKLSHSGCLADACDFLRCPSATSGVDATLNEKADDAAGKAQQRRMRLCQAEVYACAPQTDAASAHFRGTRYAVAKHHCGEDLYVYVW